MSEIKVLTNISSLAEAEDNAVFVENVFELVDAMKEYPGSVIVVDEVATKEYLLQYVPEGVFVGHEGDSQ
jgi:hypothetical protein